MRNRTPGKLSTGIDELDYICGGGWSNGLNCVAGAPGTGKTTILIQSAVKMAQQGTVVVYVTNDMRELDLTAKVMSGLSYQMFGETNCFTISDILNGGVLSKATSEAQAVIRRAEKFLPYLHIRDLIADENFDRACDTIPILAEMDKIERIFHVYCHTYDRAVFIADSLQQIAGYINSGKEGVDTQLRQFKQLSRKYQVPIVMISTLNRTGYEKPGEINFGALKESGSIEYDCDTIVTMVPQFALVKDSTMDLKAFKMSARRDIVLTCKKSRDCEEREKTMTLFAPGCTFTPFLERGEKASPQKEKKEQKVRTPPTVSVGGGWSSEGL